MATISVRVSPLGDVQVDVSTESGVLPGDAGDEVEGPVEDTSGFPVDDGDLEGPVL